MEEKIQKIKEKINSKARKCSQFNCIEDSESNDMLKCRKCERLVHYSCSELPLYQIQVCLTYKSRSFQCRNCVHISPMLQNVAKDKLSPSKNTRKEVENEYDEYNTINNMIQRMKEDIQTTIEERIGGLEKRMNEFVDDQNLTGNASFAEAAKKHITMATDDLKKIMREEKIEKKTIKSRACNLIIHGVDEIMDEIKEEQEESDKNYVEAIIMKDRLGLDIKVVKAERIGVFTKEREENERYRPLKIRLQTEEMKMNVLKNLKKLKGITCLNLRITEDLTKKERLLIKEWHKKAEKKNDDENNTNFKWRVRGSPRSGLYLKKVFCKNKSGS